MKHGLPSLSIVIRLGQELITKEISQYLVKSRHNLVERVIYYRTTSSKEPSRDIYARAVCAVQHGLTHRPRYRTVPCRTVERKTKQIPYKEGRMTDIGAHVGYTVLWGTVSKVVRAGLQMWYYPTAPPFHVIAVLSGTCVVRVLCMAMVAPYCAVACVCVGVATKCARLRLTPP